jgi:hypothetical protein
MLDQCLFWGDSGHQSDVWKCTFLTRADISGSLGASIISAVTREVFAATLAFNWRALVRRRGPRCGIPHLFLNRRRC